MKSIFDSTFTTDDPELSNLLAAARGRDFLEHLWTEYSPFITEQDKFIAGMKAQPFTRIREMYLGCALRACGLTLEPKGEEAPDLKLANPRVWVEAVVSTDGQRSQTTTQPTSRVPEVLLHESMIGGPPEDDMALGNKHR
jgi:hypothetical protein